MSNRTPKTRSLERQAQVLSSFEEDTFMDGSESTNLRKEISSIIREELEPFKALVKDIHALCQHNSKSLQGLHAIENLRTSNNQIKEEHVNNRSIQQDTYDSQIDTFIDENFQQRDSQAASVRHVNKANSNTYPKFANSETEQSNEQYTGRSTSFTSFDTKLKKPQPSPRQTSFTNEKLNAKPMLTRQQTVIERRCKPGNNRPIVNERDCLASALQSNIESIVDDMIFDESELPDQLLEDSCVTTDECSVIRNRTRQDQVRILISTIKGRDMCVLKRFVKIVERSNKDLADKINATFEENKTSNKFNGVRCPCCELKSVVDIKYVSDGLWGIEAISDGLYREIVESEQHAGSQEGLWIRLLESLNNIVKKEDRSEAFERLLSVLNRRKYSHIADKIRKSLHKDKALSCKCSIVRFQYNNLSQATTTGSSCSPQSSVSLDE